MVNDVASWINRGESVFFQFRNGKSVLNSQCKPRMFKTAEKATLGVNYIDTDAVVEYAEVVRCKECKHMIKTAEGFRHCFVWGSVNGCGDEGFCSYGERKDGAGNA